MTVQFLCKDPLISKYCQEVYGPMTVSADKLRRLLIKEARRQQWWDYTTDENGTRHLRFEEDGSPMLLVPEVRVS